MTDAPSWAVQVPSTSGVHNPPPLAAQWGNLPQAELRALRDQLVESILQIVVEALTGGLLPGSAVIQLSEWAVSLLDNLDTVLGDIDALIFGVGGTVINDVVNLLLKIQQIIDGIANGLGHLGSNFSIPELIDFLENIPASALDLTDALAVDSADVIDAIVGTSWFTDLQSVLGNPLGLGTGSLTIPTLDNIPLLGDLLSIASTDAIGAITGTTWFGDLQSLLGNPLGLGTGSPSIPGIGSIPLLNGVAAIDTLVQAWGGTGTGYIQSDLFIAAQNISNTFVTGVLTSPDIGTAIQQTVNAGAVAIGAVESGINATLAQWQSQLANIVNTFLGYNNSGAAPPATSIAGVATAAHNTITSRAVQNNLFEAMDPTANSVFPMSDIEGLTTQVTLPVSEWSTVAGYITTRDGGVKESISWLGYGGTSITGAYFNIYSVNQTNGQWTWVYQTPDFHAALGGSVPTWNFYNLAVADYLNTSPGNLWVAEMRVTGSGTHHVVGKQANLPTYPSTSIYPSAKGAHRNEWYYPAAPHPQVASVGAGKALSAKTTTYTHTIVNGLNNWYCGIFQANTSGTLNTANVTVTLGSRTATLIGSFTFMTGAVLLLYEVLGSAGTALPTGAQTVTYTETGTLGTVTLTLNSVEVSGVVSRSSMTTNSGSGTQATTAALTSDPSTVVFALFGSDEELLPDDVAGGYETLYNQAPAANANATAILIGAGATANVFGVDLAATGNFGAIQFSMVPALNHPTTVANPTTAGHPASYSTDTPFFQLTGNPGASQYIFTPLLVPFSAGTDSFTPPSWANYADIIIFAAGGGGGGGDLSSGYSGHGGSAGSATAVRLTKSQWTAAAAWNFDIGFGGTAGTSAVHGGSGGGSSVTIPGYGTITESGGAGGLTGGGTTAGAINGATEPDIDFPDVYGNDNVYGGGGGGPGVVQVATSGAGGAIPGGGGGGGGPGVSGFYPSGNGGYGGDGGAYVLFYQ